MSGDKMDVILSVKSNISEIPNDLLSNFSEFDNIANEDWNETSSIVKHEGSPGSGGIEVTARSKF